MVKPAIFSTSAAPSPLNQAMKVAILQSRASHPSCDAAACCAFMAFFVAQAAETVDDGRPKGKGETWEKWGKWKNLEKPWEYMWFH